MTDFVAHSGSQFSKCSGWGQQKMTCWAARGQYVRGQQSLIQLLVQLQCLQAVNYCLKMRSLSYGHQFECM